MIDQVVAFSKTGVVLWSRTFCSVRGDPINELIRHVLLQERRGQDEFMYGNYKLRWEVDNKRGLFYAAICQKFVPIEETDRVLALLKEEFGKRFPESEDLVKYDLHFCCGCGGGGSLTLASTAVVQAVCTARRLR